MDFDWRAGAVATLLSLMGLGRAQAAGPLSGVLSCRDIADGSTRLACYDRETAALVSPAAPSAAAPSIPPQRSVGSALPPAGAVSRPPALTPEQQFGIPEHQVAEKEVAAGMRPAEATKIEARLAAISQSADGRLVFTLDNAQVWRQLAAEGELLAKAGDPVTVSRGWLGSYWLQLKEARGCKVTRLR
jgi:hypothetical protein